MQTQAVLLPTFEKCLNAKCWIALRVWGLRVSSTTSATKPLAVNGCF